MSEPTSKRARTDAPAAVDNSYLAHLNEPHKRMTGGSSGNGTTPFDGWIPRKITGKQVENVMVSSLSCFLSSLSRREEEKIKSTIDSTLLSFWTLQSDRWPPDWMWWLGWRCQPIHDATPFKTLLWHFRSPQEVARTSTDERILDHVLRITIRRTLWWNRFRKNYSVRFLLPPSPKVFRFFRKLISSIVCAESLNT